MGLLPSHWAAALEAEGSLRVLDGEPALAALPYSFNSAAMTRALITQMRDAVLRAADFRALPPALRPARRCPRPGRSRLPRYTTRAHGAESAMRVRGGGWAWRRGVASGCLFRQGRNPEPAGGRPV